MEHHLIKEIKKELGDDLKQGKTQRIIKPFLRNPFVNRNGGKGWVGRTDVLKIQACLNFFGKFDKVHRVPYDHKSTKSDTFINPHDRPFNHS